MADNEQEMTAEEYEALHANDQPIIPDTTPRKAPAQASITGAGDGKLPEDGTVIEGGDGTEKIVHETDDEGNLSGWHKESE